jgi:hypothetical protein
MAVFWYPHSEGHTIGKAGSEGVVVHDEEYVGKAQATLERDSVYNSAFVITCSIYGWMTHTCHLVDERDAYQAYEMIKAELAEIVDVLPDQDDPEAEAQIDQVYGYIRGFVSRWQTES